jgi:hypothetical protein
MRRCAIRRKQKGAENGPTPGNLRAGYGWGPVVSSRESANPGLPEDRNDGTVAAKPR